MTTEDPNSEVDLRGQVALITGGGRGIGREIALGLARVGAAVAVVARTPEQIEETVDLVGRQGGQAIAIPADVTDQCAVERVVAEVERQLGPIDLLVNGAGIVGVVGGVAEVDPVQWWRVLEVNLRGPFICARAVLQGMLSRRRGRIVNLASIAGLGPRPGGAYSLSKAALIRFSDILAVETEGFGVSVFAIHPGNVGTPMGKELLRIAESWSPGPLSPPTIQRWASGYQKLYAEGRDDPIERSVCLVLFLASGRADALSGRYVSGEDDVADLVRRAEEIQRDDLYVLRLRK
jgi:NAD(P)-dependent dehydrogenase (short-subunit alcohol dehydrogenase family)